MDREKELLIQRAVLVTFGIFGQTGGEHNERRLRFGGSGIFIAPYLALTASHVIRDFCKLTSHPEREHRGLFKVEQRFYHHKADHGAVLFQVNPLGKMVRSTRWIVDYAWEPTWTDICFLQAAPLSEKTVQSLAGPFEWSLLPPSVGKRVTMIGYPGAQGEYVNGGRLSVDFNLIIQDAIVIEVCELQRDPGMLSFPCFIVDKRIDGGFSGGPVFCEGKLCGLACSETIDGSSVVSLWPLCLLEYDYPGFGGKSTVGGLFDNGVLQSPDWPMVRSRISKRIDEDGKSYAFIDRTEI
jgi:hypothetical protein